VLDADGWGMGADGYRHKNGQTLDLTYLTNEAPLRKLTQSLAQADWQAIGIKIDLRNSGDFQLLYCAGKFQIGEVHDNGGFDPDDSWIFASDQTCDQSGNNFMHYANPTVDQQERIQLSTDDINARKAAFHIIHEQVLTDLPVMYLYSQAGIGCAVSALHNYDPADPVGGPGDTWNVWDWYLSPPV
jgi:peptide/nickel transport system substrate-binding protein